MWSEHCCYKSSRIHLKKLPTTGPRVLQGPGENAGAVDIGDGLAAVFKIESHNHPSFIEPYQGAATGVGGIIRDIFTMGARPIALLNSLRFGPLDGPDGARTRRIVEGVVAGHRRLRQQHRHPDRRRRDRVRRAPTRAIRSSTCSASASPRPTRSSRARAAGVGNPVYYVGAKTGRDGIHGATMASAEFDEKSAEKRPAVQVGDPFMEKLLLEACLELMETDALVGVQDMGAAGLTCSTCEMGARGGSGIEIDVSHVPQRETGMTPYEIMLSESQERMLLVVKKGREAEVERDLRQVGPARGAHRRGHDDGAAARQGPRRGRRRDPEHARSSTRRRSTTGRRRARPTSTRCAARPVVAAGRSRRSDALPGDCSARRRSRASAGSTGSTTTWCGPTRIVLAGHGRRRRPREGHDARAGDVDRRQRPLLLPRSAPRRDARGRRGGAQRRLRRRACRSARPTA